MVTKVVDTDLLNTTILTTDVIETSLNTPQILIVCVAVFGIPGNIGAMVVLLSNPQIRNKAVNRFMIHQSIIDLCACITSIPTVLITDIRYVQSGKF